MLAHPSVYGPLKSFALHGAYREMFLLGLCKFRRALRPQCWDTLTCLLVAALVVFVCAVLHGSADLPSELSWIFSLSKSFRLFYVWVLLVAFSRVCVCVCVCVCVVFCFLFLIFFEELFESSRWRDYLKIGQLFSFQQTTKKQTREQSRISFSDAPGLQVYSARLVLTYIFNPKCKQWKT